MLGTECPEAELPWQVWLIVTSILLAVSIGLSVLIARWGWK